MADLKAMFTQWTIALTPEPGSVHKSVGAPNTGTLELEALPVDGSARWKVQFDVRGTAEA